VTLFIAATLEQPPLLQLQKHVTCLHCGGLCHGGPAFLKIATAASAVALAAAATAAAAATTAAE